MSGTAAAAIGLGASALSGLAGAASSHYAAKKQLEAVRETNATNLQLAREQNDWNYQQWLREAEWQGTENQMQMWKNAGMNPNFFNGGTTAPITQSADLANQQAPQVGQYYAGIGQAVQNAFSQMLSMKQLDIASREADIKQQMVENDAQRLGFEGQRTSSDLKTAEHIRNQVDATCKKIMADYEVSKATADEIRARTPTWEQQIRMTDKLLRHQDLINSQESVKLSQLKLDYKFAWDTFNTRIKQVAADLSKTYSEIGLNKQLADMYLQQAAGFALDNEEKKFTIETQGVRMLMYRQSVDRTGFEIDFMKKNRQKAFDLEMFQKKFNMFNDLLRTGCSISNEVRSWVMPFGSKSGDFNRYMPNLNSQNPFSNFSYGNPDFGF